VQEVNNFKRSAIRTSNWHEDEYRYQLPTILQVTPLATGLLVNETVLQLFKKHSWSITLYTTTRHFSLSSARRRRSKPNYPI